MADRMVVCLALVLLSGIPAGARQQRGEPAKPQPDYCAVPANAPPALPARLMEGMGKVDFPITTASSEARAFFLQGVAQMHSFWFVEAERSFLQAAALDPDAAMAYWGIAMSASGDYRPTFQMLERTRTTREGLSRARDAIARAAGLKEKVSPRERLYIEAVEARRNPDSKTADADYVRAMRRLVAAYPDDLEAKSILALALQNGYDSTTRRPRDGTMEGLALLREILARDPDHIGAHHYVIHGYEGGPEAGRAWESSKRYPELVPNIPHALHMPGHIYSQTDRLQDAAHAFMSAALNELGYMGADALYPNGHYAHNHQYLIYTLGLQGRYQEAVLRSRELLRVRENPRERAAAEGSSAYRQGWFSLLRTLVRFEKWDAILTGSMLPEEARPREAAWTHWARGLAQVSLGDLDGARASQSALERALEATRGESRSIPPPLDVARRELAGLIQVGSGSTAAGLESLREAARAEIALLYAEPPTYPRAVSEILGRVALGAGDFAAAEAAYRQALDREPGSGRALWGLAAALDGLGRREEAAQVRNRFRAAWASADTDLPELRTQEPPARAARAR